MVSMPTRVRDAWSSLRTRATGDRQGPIPGAEGLMRGGIRNNVTGMGGAGDKSEHSFFVPTRMWTRTPFEILRVQSQAAMKFTSLPIDDMIVRWRDWQGDEGDAAVEAMEMAEKRHLVKRRLGDAMKAARLYGSSLLVMVSREAPMDTPLMPERIREGDLLGLLVFDRYSAYVRERGDELMMPDTYGQPTMYELVPNRGRPMLVHASRVLRFDGIPPLGADGFTMYDYDWGVSAIIPAMLSIMQDQTIATAAAHLTQVASIPVVSIDRLRETMAGGGQAAVDAGEMTPAQIGAQINQMMSVFRLLLLEKGTEEFNRVAVQFSGLEDIMDRFERRLAGAADIPITRWSGQSPGGLNATGDSDWRNYAVMLEQKREQLLDPVLPRFDEVIARDAGVREVPSFTWLPFIDIGEKDKAETSKIKAEALQIGVQNGAVDEDEMRAALDGDPTFGALSGEAPGMPEPDLPAPAGGPGNPSGGI